MDGFQGSRFKVCVCEVSDDHGPPVITCEGVSRL